MAALAEVKRMVNRKEIRLADYLGTDSITRIAIALQLRMSTGNMLALHSAAMDQARSMLEALKGPRPSPLEEIAAEAVMIAWLDYQGKACRTAGEPDVPSEVLALRDKALTQALRRLTMAVKMLDQLRRMDLGGLLNFNGPLVVNVEAGPGEVEAITDVTPGGSPSRATRRSRGR